MKGPRSFRHETIAYERPTLPYRCGRGALWRRTCWQGPGVDGDCGGRFECAPARIGDRWECRRPKLAGGKCDSGPLPDGSCANGHPPCVPRRSLRSLRGHLSALAVFGLLALLIVGIDPTVAPVVNPLALDAGELTSVHAGFTKERGCAACHASHEKEALGWLAAAFRSNDASAKCLDCHEFPGPAAKAHNTDFAKRPELGTLSCTRCHTEHQGAGAKIAQIPDYICANCHQRPFDSFGGHAPFGARYPFNRPGVIHFDHAKHINKYFGDPKVARRSKAAATLAAAAKTQCTACHAVEGATREVRPKPYGEICSACHEGDIAKAEFVLLDPERLTPAASVLLGMEREGDDEAAAKLQARLWDAMARNGTDALLELAAGADEGRKKSAPALFAGLGSQTAREAGSAWAARRPLPASGRADAPGWATGENSDGKPALFYRAVHADPVLKSWIEQLRGAAADKDEKRRKLASDALDQFLDSGGPGSCGNCHAAALRAAPAERAGEAWRRAGRTGSAHTRYSHAPHLGLVDPDAGCRTCHELNPEASAKYGKYFAANPPKPEAYHSNFLGISTQACVQCHREGQVNAACQVCHAYHLPHRFNLGFRTRGAQK